MAYGFYPAIQDIGRALCTPIKSEVMFYQLLGRAERPRDYVVYDGIECHYVPRGNFFVGPVVAKWLVPETSKEPRQ